MIRFGGSLMRMLSLVIMGVLLGPPASFAQQTPSRDIQIAGALLAAPEDRRAGAAVLGWDEKGSFVTLRPGTNDLICLADNPKLEGFNVACYHKDLDPFMARGREMTAQGITDDTVRDQTRWKEIEAGTLKMPREPRALYVLSGKSFDSNTGEVANKYERWVLYVPFATAETTGLGTKPIDTEPWLMNPGTAGAHIMIAPPRPK
jgi:hypothetical protein